MVDFLKSPTPENGGEPLDLTVAQQQPLSLFQQIQMVLAGHSERAVMQALLQSLLVVIGVSAPSVARAEMLIDALPGELKPILRREWLNYRAHRAKAHA